MLYWSSSRSSYVLFGEMDVVFRMPLGFRSQMTQIVWILRILVGKVHSPFCLMPEFKHLWRCKSKQQKLTRTDIQLFPCILEPPWGSLTAEVQGEGRVRSALHHMVRVNLWHTLNSRISVPNSLGKFRIVSPASGLSVAVCVYSA